MTTSMSATLGGIALNVPRGARIGWTMRTGTRPESRIFVSTSSRAQDILARAQTQFKSDQRDRMRTSGVSKGPLTLEIKAPGFRTLVYRGLFVISTQPGDSVRTLGLLVADRRFFWNRVWVERRYNIRRRTGERRLLEGEVTPLEVATNTADFGFERATLNEGVKWSAFEVLEDVLTELCGRDGFKIQPGVFGSLLANDINDLTISDSGENALSRALAHLPGLAVFMDTDGKATVINTLDGSELQAVKAAGAPIEGSGTWEKVDRRLARPRLVHTGLQRESELRVDFEEGRRATVVPGEEPLDMVNVIPVPEITLKLTNGNTVAQGTWVQIDDYLDAIALLNDFPPGKLGKLTQALIRKHYLSGFAILYNIYVAIEGTANPVWARRLSAIKEHWRRTYRFRPQWRDKIRTLRAYRVAIMDQETGTRGRAEAFHDYIVKPSEKTLAKLKGQNFDMGYQVQGHADNLKNAKRAPTEVQVIDNDNLIIRITPRVDSWGVTAAIAPGNIQGSFPKTTAGDARILWNDPNTGLSPNFKLSIVLTATQAVPNSTDALHFEKVGPSEAADRLPSIPTIGPSSGPDWYTKIRAGRETARFAWRDEDSAAIKDAFFKGLAPPQSLMINPDRVRDLAAARAAQIYALLLDRVEGSFSVSILATAKPTGSLAQVTHEVVSSGDDWVAATRFDLPPITVPPDIWALLPESTRAVLQKQVIP